MHFWCRNMRLKWIKSPNSQPILSPLLLHCILMCKSVKQALFSSSQNVLSILSVLPSDLLVAELKPLKRRQESLLLTILKVCYFAFERVSVASAGVCEVRSVKEFIVCSPPVIILVPINLLASLEPVAIWKHCSVYKLGKDQHSGALTSHTNLETIRARQSG